MLDGDNTSPWRGHTLDPNQSGRYHPGIGYYPFSGYLYPDGGLAAIKDVDASAYFWTSWKGDSSTGIGTGLMISDGTYDPVKLGPPINKNYGVSVRCVVDRNYLINTGGGGLFGSGAGDMENEIL
jgi:hypothetical protein